MESKRSQVLEMARRAGAVRPRDVTAAGLPREYLSQLHRAGVLDRVGRGLYVAHESEISEHQSLLEACLRVPHGVIALLSALRFHDLTTQAPFEIWMAIDVKSRRPDEPSLPLRIVRFSGKAFTEGIETHLIDSVTIRVYHPAKTIADCFKYRNKIGIDVAIEALRDGWRQRKVTMDDLWRYAAICRVTNVIRPYLEML